MAKQRRGRRQTLLEKRSAYSYTRDETHDPYHAKYVLTHNGMRPVLGSLKNCRLFYGAVLVVYNRPGCDTMQLAVLSSLTRLATKARHREATRRSYQRTCLLL